MPRNRSEALTEREAQIMAVLWDGGPATADAIREALPDPLHDSTVRTLLRVLEAKGYVRHAARGKAYVYRPVVARANAERTAVRGILQRFFGGSVEALVLRLVEDEQLSAQHLEALKQRLRERE